MRQTVVGVFDRYESARHAANLLADSGFAPDAVQVAGDEESLREEGRESGLMERVRSFFAEVFGSSGEAPATCTASGAKPLSASRLAAWRADS